MAAEGQKDIIMIDGTEYYFNTKRIFEFITRRAEKTEKEKEVVDSYEYGDESDVKLTTKVVRELTTPTETQYDTIKYDLLKTFIIQIITYSDKTKVNIPDNDAFEVPIINVSFMPLGTRIVFNTLVEEGILIKKENNQK